MANFNEAYDITMGHEGRYVYDPDDRGGETYKGISRKYWPGWKGWEIIDKVKNRDRPAINDAENQTLDEAAEEFYKHHFWHKLRLDDCKNQRIANELFDTAVNQWIRTASKYLQRSLNLLNRDQRDWKDIKVDGKVGPITMNMLNHVISRGSRWIEGLLKCLNGEQYIRYRMIALFSKKQEKFFHGWLKRVNF